RPPPPARPPGATTRQTASAVPVRLQPEAAAGRPTPVTPPPAAAARPQTRGHPYHRPDRRQRSPTLDIAAAWAWFYAEGINRVESDEDQELDLRSASASQHLQINENEEILEICVICFIRVSNAKAMPCQHRFCRRCIERWMEEGNPGCPMCRTIISHLQ
ncbi:Uncharacterized protein FWK35_00035464, partial [Aphis craccivora]